jgi:hypothetical protein
LNRSIIMTCRAGENGLTWFNALDGITNVMEA